VTTNKLAGMAATAKQESLANAKVSARQTALLAENGF